jgi:hypothetical protein
VITSAQNATPVHPGFWASLQRYCEHNDAELVVIPLRYKNPTSRWSESQENAERWLTDIPDGQRFLFNQRKKLGPNLVLMADVKTQPTAVTPLSGLDAMTHGESGIVGHTKLQLKTVATPQGKYPKIMTTTGACTVENYTDSKAGKKGEFHHVLGAVVVELKGSRFHLRQLLGCKDGSFIDLENEYRPDGVRPAERPIALVLGDTHRKFMDPRVERATFGPNGINRQLNPYWLVFHDLHDGYAENPHTAGNPLVALAKARSGFNDVEKEVREDYAWLRKVVLEDQEAVLVHSNHNDFLSRWVMNSDWRLNPANAEFYLRTALMMVESTQMSASGAEWKDPFSYWMERMNDEAGSDGILLRCLKVDESFCFGGVELGMHGHLGPDGARGSRSNLKKIGVKSIIGHGHGPGIEEGCYQVGTSSPLRLEYNRGPSSWMHTHAILYANHKRALINIVDGQWRG